jgi:hypothetical protein
VTRYRRQTPLWWPEVLRRTRPAQPVQWAPKIPTVTVNGWKWPGGQPIPQLPLIHQIYERGAKIRTEETSLKWGGQVRRSDRQLGDESIWHERLKQTGTFEINCAAALRGKQGHREVDFEEPPRIWFQFTWSGSFSSSKFYPFLCRVDRFLTLQRTSP